MDDHGNGVQQGPMHADMTMPKVLDFLQTEWFKYEVDRSHWVAEKADLKNRIIQLESEKKSNEQIKNDLCKRIKMLEYALQQERVKNSTLYNSSSSGTPQQQPQQRDNIAAKRDFPKSSRENMTRAYIKKYLKDIGYNDIIVTKPEQDDIYSQQQQKDITIEEPTIFNFSSPQSSNTVMLNTNNSSRYSPSTQEIEQQLETEMNGLLHGNNDNNNNKPPKTTTTTSTTATSPPTAVVGGELDTLKDLMQNTTEMDLSQSLSSLGSFDHDSLLDSLKELDEGVSNTTTPQDSLTNSNDSFKDNNSSSNNNNNNNDQYNSFNEEDFFNKLSANSKGRMKLKLGNIKGLKSQYDDQEDDNGSSSSGSASSGGSGKKKSSNGKKSSSSSSNNGGSIKGDSMKKKLINPDLLGLGTSDLNDITLDDSSSRSATGGADSTSPRTWRHKHSLKSHFDGVRSILFHPDEPLLLSASEDHTIKLWNLTHLTPSTKKGAAVEIEPLYTYRGHLGPVFTTALSQDNKSFFSAGYDMIIKQWTIPPMNLDPYDCHGKVINYLEREFVGHTDGIWDLVPFSPSPGVNQLLSSSADGSIALWDIMSSMSQLCTFIHPLGRDRIPTSISLPPSENYRKMLASYNDGSVLLWDLETGQVVQKVKQEMPRGCEEQVNKIVSHPFLPLAIMGTEDHKIEFWDLSAPANIVPVHSMIAHSNSISSLAIDPSGLYLSSCSHDSSIRFWDISSKTCTQDLLAHRPKFDEAIHCISYHPTKGYFASGGADAIVKLNYL